MSQLVNRCGEAVKQPPAPLDRPSPRVPLFLLANSGRPLVWNHERGKAVIAYSTGPAAVTAARLMLSRGFREIGVLTVSTEKRLQEVVAQLARHGVRSMIWDYLEDSPTREFINLSTVPGAG
jgi:hypothetical protein